MIKKILVTLGIIAVFAYAVAQDPIAKEFCIPVNGEKHIYSWQCLSETYAPTELVNLVDRDNYLYYPHQLSKPAAIAVNKMIKDAEEDGMCLVVMGGYRSAKLQKEMWEKTPDDKKDGVARPYRSEHQTGLAVDLVGCPMKDGVRDDTAEREDLKLDFDKIPEYQWLLKHASEYGFEQSYTEDNQWLTGYKAESWHWKYVH